MAGVTEFESRDRWEDVEEQRGQKMGLGDGRAGLSSCETTHSKVLPRAGLS